MKYIELTRNKKALVDDADFEWLNQWKWWVAGNYVVRDQHIRMEGKKEIKKRILIHRLIMGFPEGMKVDHEDGNPLNNQRYNLRICSNMENSRNSSKSKSNTSGYKGVFLHSPKQNLTKPWRARIKVDHKLYWASNLSP